MRRAASDAIVFFGATGDLAYKQIFPSLQAPVRDEGLSVPIVGVAKTGWSLDQLKTRAKDSVSNHGGLDTNAFAKLTSLLRYVDGDYNDPGIVINPEDVFFQKIAVENFGVQDRGKFYHGSSNR
jgi:glucose-6-phosphate 1-dehydrogenase